MDRLNQLRGVQEGSADSSLDSSQAYLTANESSSKYFSFSDGESSLQAVSVKDASVPSTDTVDGTTPVSNQLIAGLSPITKRSDLLDNYKIDKHIDAAKILSGGVDIFDDNDNSYGGNDLIIDDGNVDTGLEGKEKIFSADPETGLKENDSVESGIDTGSAIGSKDPEVVLHIDGKNLQAIDIGNGLYLYRNEGQEELAAVQIIDPDQQDYKFLKVRENAEGNLEVYEEIEVEVPKEVPSKSAKAKNTTSNIPVKDEIKTSDPINQKVDKIVTPPKAVSPTIKLSETVSIPESPKSDNKHEINFNGKPMKLNEAKKSSLMTFHSTPNKEGIPLTKTMVNMQLQPSRHSENVKKTIEVNTENCKQKILDTNKADISTDIEETKVDNVVSTDINIVEDKKVESVPNEETSSGTKKTTSDKGSTKDHDIEPSKIKESKPNIDKNASQPVSQPQINLKPINKSNEEPVETPKTIEQNISNKTGPTTNKIETVKEEMPKDKDVGKVDAGKGLDSFQIKSSKKETVSPMKPSVDAEVEAVNKVIEHNQEVPSKPKLTESELEKQIFVTKKEVQVTSKEPIPKKDEGPVKDELSKLKNIEVVDASENKNIMEQRPLSQLLEQPKEKQVPLKLEDKRDVKSAVPNLISTSLVCETVKTQIETIKTVDAQEHKITNLPKENTLTEGDTRTNVDKNTQLDISKIESTETLIPKPDNNDKSNVFTNITSPNIETKIEFLDKKKVVPILVAKAATPKEKNAVQTEKSDQKQPQLEEIHVVKSQKDVEVSKLESKETDKKYEAVSKEKTSDSPKTNVLEPDKKAEVLEKIEKKVEGKRRFEDICSIETEEDSTESPLVIDLKPTEEPKNTSDDLIQLTDLDIDTANKSSDKIELPSPKLNAIPSIIVRKDAKAPLDINKHVEVKSNTALHDATKMSPIAKPEETIVGPAGQHINIPNVDILKESPVSGNKPRLLENTAFIDKCVSKALLIRLPETTEGSTLKSSVPQTKTATPINVNLLAKKPESDASKVTSNDPTPLVVNNNNPVPFGKWTEAHKQDYLNKMRRETKVVSNNASTNQIKQPFDLNRRDFLQKINKMNVRREASAFVPVKGNVKPEVKIVTKIVDSTKIRPEELIVEARSESSNLIKPERNVSKAPHSLALQKPTQVSSSSTKLDTGSLSKQMSYFIDRTVDSRYLQRLPRNMPNPPALPSQRELPAAKPRTSTGPKQTGLEAIEMEMKKLHGIPLERPSHELPPRYSRDILTYPKPERKPEPQKGARVPSLAPMNKQSTPNVELDSDDEVIEHEPVTGDMEVKKYNTQLPKPQPIQPSSSTAAINTNEGAINEKDFETFARRNSFTYDSCITVSYEQKQQIVHPVVTNDLMMGKYNVPRKVSHPKPTLLHGTNVPISQSKTSAFVAVHPRMEDVYSQNSQSKLQIAYQSALTAKKHKKSPITVLNEQPVKVVYMDTNAEYIVGNLNAQGKELSPAKKTPAPEAAPSNPSSSIEADVSEISKAVNDNKKPKHQRKQVLTPVNEPALEIVDSNIEESSEKKRKIDKEMKLQDRGAKAVLPKKNYLLGRSAVVEDNSSESNANSSDGPMSATASAIDNLVKAAELLENQAQSSMKSTSSTETSGGTPTSVKRGRGRPRKYPVPEGGEKPVTPSPQKKTRVSRTPLKPETSSDDDSGSDFETVMENWTMGKINKHIVCPICNKLFRSENVVYKHVKHCTGPSPNRSDSDTRSQRRHRRSFESQDSDSDSSQTKSSYSNLPRKTPKKTKLKSEDTTAAEVIVIEDTPVKPKQDKSDASAKRLQTKASVKSQPRPDNLVCEICGKTFRQRSYLISHRLQHKNEELKKPDPPPASSTVFSCEVCKKDFRKLHHLVQHRIIHNPTTSRNRRKSSAEQSDKAKDNPESSKNTDDQSAGFRCEQCDKSFRKLHHLVEHRETHDGVNQKKNPAPQANVEKVETAPPQCDICKKTFRKLHHLVEHKESHVEVSSEKSDDKSVKSALSAKDIIHECSLCYMVFPNEHSLNKHFGNCQRKKKRQSLSKPAETEDAIEEKEELDGESLPDKPILKLPKQDTVKDTIPAQKRKSSRSAETLVEPETEVKEQQNSKEVEQKITPKEVNKESKEVKELKPKQVQEIKSIRKSVDKKENKSEDKLQPTTSQPAEKPQHVPEIIETIVIEDTPKKKVAPKDKIAATVTKRQKTTNLQLPEVEPYKSLSDDDDVRYMLNPDFKEETAESKLFMKVRSNKRSSLQIERITPNEHIKRRISLQHPPKTLKKVKTEAKPQTKSNEAATSVKTEKYKEPASTDSDDSDVKYSFPIKAEEQGKSEPKEEKKAPKKSLTDKRKSLGGIAKRKSLGRPVTKGALKPPAVKVIRRRTAEAEHRCDCGELFGSAALLSRHTTLMHTPPRIRKRRSPPPEPGPKTTKVKEAKPVAASRKSSVKSDISAPTRKSMKAEVSKPTRKSVVPTTSSKSGVRSDVETKDVTPNKRAKKTEDKTDTETKGKSCVKQRRSAAHRGVPVPEKMRKLMEKLKK